MTQIKCKVCLQNGTDSFLIENEINFKCSVCGHSISKEQAINFIFSKEHPRSNNRVVNLGGQRLVAQHLGGGAFRIKGFYIEEVNCGHCNRTINLRRESAMEVINPFTGRKLTRKKFCLECGQLPEVKREMEILQNRSNERYRRNHHDEEFD